MKIADTIRKITKAFRESAFGDDMFEFYIGDKVVAGIETEEEEELLVSATVRKISAPVTNKRCALVEMVNKEGEKIETVVSFKNIYNPEIYCKSLNNIPENAKIAPAEEYFPYINEVPPMV